MNRNKDKYQVKWFLSFEIPLLYVASSVWMLINTDFIITPSVPTFWGGHPVYLFMCVYVYLYTFLCIEVYIYTYIMNKLEWYEKWEKLFMKAQHGAQPLRTRKSICTLAGLYVFITHSVWGRAIVQHVLLSFSSVKEELASKSSYLLNIGFLFIYSL